MGAWGLGSSAIDSQAFTQFFLLKWLGYVNILMGILNLMPSLPFDGGRAVQALISFRLPEFKATRHVGHIGLIVTPLVFIYGMSTRQSFVSFFAFMGFITSLMTLGQTGGVRFGEVFADRKAKKEIEAVKLRDKAKNEEYLDNVRAREKQREERERLRRLLESSSDEKGK